MRNPYRTRGGWAVWTVGFVIETIALAARAFWRRIKR